MTGSETTAVTGAFSAACIDRQPPPLHSHPLRHSVHQHQVPAFAPTSTVGAFSFSAAATEIELCLAVATSASLTFRIRTQQRATWSGPTSASGGSSTLHRSTTKGHRGWNLQPGGALVRSGGNPLMLTSRSLRASSTRGTDRSSDQV